MEYRVRIAYEKLKSINQSDRATLLDGHRILKISRKEYLNITNEAFYGNNNYVLDMLLADDLIDYIQTEIEGKEMIFIVFKTRTFVEEEMIDFSVFSR